MSVQIKAVMYCDAGFHPYNDTTASGYGVHGYTYTDDEPKKGTGNPKVVPTNNGYEGPLDTRGGLITGDKVTVEKYFDIVGSEQGLASNGEAELEAFNTALKWLQDNPDVIEAKIFSDAMFVTKSVNEYLSGWVAKDWVRHNGEPVKYKDRWVKCNDLMTSLKERVKIKVEWIKGHNGHIGNDMADKLATKGRIAATFNKEPELRTFENEAQGYWKPKSDAPRILQAARWYFDTVDRTHKSENGLTTFLVGCHGPKEKDTELVGKPYSDNYLGVVKVKEAPEFMNALRDYAFEVDSAKIGRIVVGHLDQILSAKEVADFNQFGLGYHTKSKRQIYVRSPEKSILLTEMDPPGQGFRMMETWKILDKRLEEFKNGDAGYQVTDITDLLYEAQGKKGQLKLKSNWTQKVKYMDVTAKFNLELASAMPKPFDMKVRLILGQDILSRNQLAALAPDVVSVKVISWRQSDQVGRYATYVELSNGDYGLWSRYEANYVLHSLK